MQPTGPPADPPVVDNVPSGDRAPAAPEGWVPADRRWLGFDTRTKTPALITVGVAILFVVLIPLLTGLKDWDNPVRAGDLVRLGSSITVAPPVGWNLEGGARTTETPAGKATNEPVTVAGPGSSAAFQLVTGIGDSTAQDLVERAARAKDLQLRIDEYALHGSAGTVRTASGLTGVRRSFVTPSASGEIVAFRVPATTGGPVGLIVEIDSAGGLDSDQQEIDAMLDSLSLVGATS